ncbi:hypothetical protein BKH42_02370 [Helicobacter sp. 13S00482-2]|uniref:hypothetical protein n=1 Tax=Helicobacter sp. 13S00482-2 TaxID=1476200 RepID=UPI000BA70B72|nr:hypothetical protein [Helicobacter sp. 13S00482-2]PAF54078.1 hypothetical protein BKH42_02370 [Helicobacter sp. 13S00482-2]
MKKILIILTIFCSYLFSEATIKKIEIFDRNNSIDVIFFSDMIFTSPPQEFNIQNEKIILLKNTKTEQKIQKKFPSSILDSLEVFSKNKDLYIIPKSKLSFKITASKSKDSYTLRLRFTPKKSIDNIQSIIKSPLSVKPASINRGISSDTPNLGVQDYQYWLVLAIMVALILVMLFVRRKLSLNKDKKTIFEMKNSKLQILATKNIDTNNKLLLIGGEKYEYLILLGNKQNILIDKIHVESPEFIKEIKHTGKTKMNQKRIIDDKIWTSLK